MVPSRFQPLNRPYLPVDISSDSQVVATFLSLTEHAADLSLLLEPLIWLPNEMLLIPMPVLMRPQSSHGQQSPGESFTSVDSSPLDLSREGPFDAYCEPEVNR